MNPKATTIYNPDNKSYVSLSEDQVKDYSYTGQTEKVGSVRCAVFTKDGKKYYQPWDKLSFLRRRGENNISAKLTTAQVRAIVKEAYTKNQSDVTYNSLAEKYGVKPERISDIVNGRAWRHVTVGLIAQLRAGNKEVLDSCVSASNKQPRKKNIKLNASLAKFIVRDHLLNKISIQDLANKFNLSESSVRRIVTGKAWKEATIPAIAEFSKWK
jgi:plasmid maintenance system antidote protein VapI